MGVGVGIIRTNYPARGGSFGGSGAERAAAERVLGDDPFGHRLAVANVLAQDALESQRDDAAMPDTLRIDDLERAAGADAKAGGLRAHYARGTILQALLDVFPRLLSLRVPCHLSRHAPWI